MYNLHMLFIKNYKNLLSSFACYVAVFVVYFAELSLFGNTISTATSQSSYSMYLVCMMILPILLVLFGIYFAYKSKKVVESKWLSKLLIVIGILFVLILIFGLFLGSSINGSEAALLHAHKIV
jgi:hypothetical protein